MHLHVVMAFALLIWSTGERIFEPMIHSGSTTVIVIVAQMVGLYLAGVWTCRRDLRSLRGHPDGSQRAQQAHHRSVFLLRAAALGLFASVLMLTQWPEIVSRLIPMDRIPALAKLITVAPFLVTLTLILLTTFPFERALRSRLAGMAESMAWHDGPRPKPWNLRTYLVFHIRHQLLAVTAPMLCILVAYDLTRAHHEWIARSLRIPWASDLILGLLAAVVFITAPWMLKHIWMTSPLSPGPLRQDLQRLCDRVGLKCRDILIWESGGMMINAAVMGVVAPFRYVILSDGLIDSMNAGQIEAVFGHEAGHVRHKHIQFFLLFALVSMLVASGVMEVLYRMTVTPDAPLRLGLPTIQGIGILTIVAVWAIGFGFVSRRFEWQADVFGARCVSPEQSDECKIPCGVHSAGKDAERASSHLCASGAAIFASALDRVAVLNGIPPTEWSWRHSSISNRVNRLRSLAADPVRLRRFERGVTAIKWTLAASSVVGLAASAYYVWPFVVQTLARSR